MAQQSATLPSSRPDGRALIALSKINVVEGFNPRTTMEQTELEQLAASLREVGMLQPVVLAPADENGEHALIAGGRRYAAAALAAMTEIPYVIDTRADAGSRLDVGMIENLVRTGLTPVEEAHGCRRMLEEGFTRKGIAQRVSKPAAWVRDRLALLDLPEALHPLIDAGTIPLKAVKPLLAIARVHPGLATLAAEVVVGSASGEEPWSWEDLDADPVEVITRDLDDLAGLPAEVFCVRRGRPTGYPVSRFTLTQDAARSLPELCAGLPDRPTPEDFVVSFGAKAVEGAAALKATLESAHGWVTLIVGQDVADQLASDYVTRALAVVLEQAKEKQAAADTQSGGSPTESGPVQVTVGSGPDGEPGRPAGPTAEEVAERRRAERAAELSARMAAQEANLRLGAAVFGRLSRLKVDERVVKLLAAIDLAGDLAKIAERGARYGFPGWVTVETKGEQTKRSYLPLYDAERKATEYLAGAQSVGDYAGRCVALIVMAHLADEAAVAMSNRSHYTVVRNPSAYSQPVTDRGLPWAADVCTLIEELAIERLPDEITAPLVEQRATERRDAEREAEARAAKEAAVAALLEQLPTLDADAREAAARAFRHEHGGDWTIADRLRDLARADQNTTPAGEEDADEGDAVALEGGPAPAGTRAEQALEVIARRPGITIPELAEQLAIKQNHLYRILPDLAQQGLVAKTGRGWHPIAVSSEPGQSADGGVDSETAGR